MRWIKNDVYLVRVVDDNGNELPRGSLGNLVVKLPLPLGTFLTLWEDEERFLNTYFQRYKVQLWAVFFYDLYSWLVFA